MREEIVKLVLMTEDATGDLAIGDYFSEGFFESNFWAYWSTMFAFETWHSLAEMRRYLMRFIHDIDGLADFSSVKFTRYNQYDSMVKPVLGYLAERGVDIRYGVEVRNVRVDVTAEKKTAVAIVTAVEGAEEIPLTENDLVFVTNGPFRECSVTARGRAPSDPGFDTPRPKARRICETPKR